jgi:gliding motility-associated-like protein
MERKYLIATVLFCLFFCSNNAFAQHDPPCIYIERILVDACGSPEGPNEMLTFKVGNNPLNTSDINVNWPSNNWQGLRQDAVTAGHVDFLNNTIEGCGLLVEPLDGILPANSTVLLICGAGPDFDVTAHSYQNLNEQIYVLFQNINPNTGNDNTQGHFANWNTSPGLRTTTISFGPSCSSTVTYDRTLLTNQSGGIGGSPAERDGALAIFDAQGNVTYDNLGCVPPFTAPSPDWNLPNFTFCESDEPINLINFVTGNLGGNFSGTGVEENIFNPDGLSGEVEITYSLTPAPLNPTCTFDSTLTVTVTPSPSAAWDNSDISCQNQGILDLNDLVEGTEGGTFSGSGVTNNTLNLSENNGEIEITYTVGETGCQATVTQTLFIEPLPDTPIIEELLAGCANQFEPSAVLTNENGSLQWFNDEELENLVFEGLSFSPGILTNDSTLFVANFNNNCFSEIVPVNFVVNPIPATPELDSNNQVCDYQTIIDLEVFGSGIINWFNTEDEDVIINTGTSLSVDDFSQSFGVFSIENQCISDTLNIEIEVISAGDPSWNNTPIACNIEGEIDLTTLITGTLGGTFSGSGVTDNLIDVSDIGQGIEITYTVTNLFCTETETLILTVEPQPDAPNFSGTPTACANQSIDPIEVSASGTAIWFTDENLENQIFEGNVFTPDPLAESTTFWVINSDNDCESEPISITINVSPSPETPELSEPAQACESDTELTLTLVQPGTYQWFFMNNPTVVVATGSTYTTNNLNEVLGVIATQGDCISDTLFIEIDIIDSPVPPVVESFDIPCLGSTLTLNTSSTGIINWFADAQGNNLLFTGNSFETPAINANTSFYVQSVVGSCQSDLIQVLVEPTEGAPISISHQGSINLCNEDFLVVSLDGATNAVWNAGFGNELSVTLVESGNYTVQASNQCVTENFSINLNFVEIIADFELSTQEGIAPLPVEAFNFSTGANSFSWSVEPNATLDILGEDANFLFSEPGFYTVSLIAIDSNTGCEATSTQNVLVTMDTTTEIFIPNTFTPNGDGVNDTFRVVGLGFNTFNLQIFNRWGSSIYETNNPEDGWDGTHKGSEVPTGTYHYVVNIRGADGQFYNKTGSLHLFR